MTLANTFITPRVQATDHRLAVWIRLDDLAAGLESLEPNQDCISRVLVSDHCIAPNSIDLTFRVADGDKLARQAVQWCKQRHLPVLMGLGNYKSGFGYPKIITTMLKSPEKQAQHIEKIVQAISYYGYDGVDLDYENLPPGVREELTAFIAKLAAALHQLDKKMDITVPPKFSSPGWKQTRAYDWTKLPNLVDRFNVMCYDWFVQSGPPGPIIPLGVTQKVIRFIKKSSHPEKFWIGHPAYGNHWTKKKNKWRGSYDGAKKWQLLAERKKVEIQYDTKPVGGFQVGDFAHYHFNDTDGSHQVWYGDHRSLDVTLKTVQDAQLGGVFIWRAGFEDEQLWEVIRQKQD